MAQERTIQISEELQTKRAWSLLPLLSGLVVLAGALASVGLTALGMPQLLAFFLCVVPAGASFALTLLARRREQRGQHTLLITLTATCQAVLEGRSAARVSLESGGYDQEAHQFSKTLNVLLDSYTYLERERQERKQELARLYDHIEQLVYDIKPVMDGDLRAKSAITEGMLGNIAATCNALIEDTAQLIQWAQSMSDQIIQTSHRLVNLSLDIAQNLELFFKHYEPTTRTIETLVASTRRMESALFSTIAVVQENWGYPQGPQDRPAGANQSLAARSADGSQVTVERARDMPQQIRHLEKLLQQTQATTTLAEKTIDDLYKGEQRFQQMNGIMVQFVSMIGSLALLADTWRHAAENYVLPGDKEAPAPVAEAEQALLALPFTRN